MSKLLKAAATVCVIGLGTIASASAFAERGHPGPRFGIYLGPAYAPFHDPFYPAPYYPFAADVYAQPVMPPLFIDGGVVASAPPPQPDPSWYFCQETRAYYPYAKTCPSPWQRVPAQASMPAS